MEENYQGYNQPEYENDDPRKGANKSILGYRIVIIILAVILAAITLTTTSNNSNNITPF